MKECNALKYLKNQYSLNLNSKQQFKSSIRTIKQNKNGHQIINHSTKIMADLDPLIQI